LSDYNIQKGAQRRIFKLKTSSSHLFEIVFVESTLHLVLRLRGGGKKRKGKKKQYTTPKKNKRKRRKVRMAILKYYEVDAEGNIKRLRRECTNQTCGAATFMANHANRQYFSLFIKFQNSRTLTFWMFLCRTCGKCGATFVAVNPEKVAKEKSQAKKKPAQKG
jgi:ribosomal protein S27AE